MVVRGKHNLMKTIFCAAVCLVLGACSTTTSLTEVERQKLDPQLVRLLNGDSGTDSDFDSTVRKDGAREYGVIIRSDNADEVKKAGIQIGSAFNNIITARVTPAELRKILTLPSVRSVQSSSKNYPH
jgi:hypothetical protein